MVEEALSYLGGVDSLIKPNLTVVVQPNAVHEFPPKPVCAPARRWLLLLLGCCVKRNPNRLYWPGHQPVATHTLPAVGYGGDPLSRVMLKSAWM